MAVVSNSKMHKEKERNQTRCWLSTAEWLWMIVDVQVGVDLLIRRFPLVCTSHMEPSESFALGRWLMGSWLHVLDLFSADRPGLVLPTDALPPGITALWRPLPLSVALTAFSLKVGAVSIGLFFCRHTIAFFLRDQYECFLLTIAIRWLLEEKSGRPVTTKLSVDFDNEEREIYDREKVYKGFLYKLNW